MNFYTSVNRYGNNILYRGFEDGERVARKIPFMPTLYVPSTHETGWFNLQNQPVLPKTFDTMRDAGDFIKQYEGVDNFSIYGTTNYVTQYIAEQYPGEVKFDRDSVNVTTIDIEVASDDGFPFAANAAHPVISITMKNNIDNNYYVWGLYDYEPESCEVGGIDRIVYKKCTDEIDLLLSWLHHWRDQRHCPDIVTGWNIRLFDLPYLINRMINIIGGDTFKKISPWLVVDRRDIVIAGRNNIAYEIVGIQQLDYYDLFRKFCYAYGTLESYKLDHVCHIVLNEKKLSYEEYGNLHSLYKHDFQKFIDYNIKDVQLVDRLDEKLGLISLAMTMAYRGGVNYSETFGTTSIWDSILYRSLFDRQVVVPPRNVDIKTAIPGAYVKEPQIGMHEWVVSFDLNSLYPNIIVQYNMSPETIYNHTTSSITVDNLLDGVVEVPDPEYATAASGLRFRKDQEGIIPRMIRQYYDERVLIKKRMISAKQQYEILEKELAQLNRAG